MLGLQGKSQSFDLVGQPTKRLCPTTTNFEVPLKRPNLLLACVSRSTNCFAPMSLLNLPTCECGFTSSRVLPCEEYRSGMLNSGKFLEGSRGAITWIFFNVPQSMR